MDNKLDSELKQAIKNYVHENLTLDCTFFYKRIIKTIEPIVILSALELCEWNFKLASEILGITRTTLRSKVKYYFDEDFIKFRKNKNN